MTFEKPKWKVPGLFKADPSKVWDEIKTLDEKTPDAVVELARNENSVLHDLIDWDDKIAAEKWRRQQARIIMCNLVVEVQENKDSEPIELRILYKTDEDKEYRDIEFAVRHEDEYEKLLKQAKRDLLSYQTKYHILKELKPIFELINEL